MTDTTTTLQGTVVLISGLVLLGCGVLLAIIAMVRMGVENSREKQQNHAHRASGRGR